MHRRLSACRYTILCITLVTLCLLSTAGWALGTFNITMDTGATVWGDFNNDYWPDMADGSTVWINNHDGTFSATLYGYAGASVALGDGNNDGFLDIFGYVAGEAGNGGPRLFTNNAGAGWIDDTARFLPGYVVLINRAMTVGDFNGDGFLDTYVTGWCNPWLGPPEHDIIFTSNSGITYSHTWTSEPDQYGKGVSAVDFDEDGDLDIYVSNYWLTPNQLWRNDGFDGFTGLTDVAPAYGANDAGHTIGSAVGDFDNDGHFDIFVCNFAHPGNPPVRFLQNQGPAGSYHFTSKGQCGVVQMEPIGAAALADYDNDGYLDVFISVVGGYGLPQPKLYRNNGNWTFTDVTTECGLDIMRRSMDNPPCQAAWADYDNDGFLDLAADSRLWRNPASGNWPGRHYLKVKLVGGQGSRGLVNKAAIGAQVRIDVPGLGTLSRQVEGNTGQGMQNDLTLHFGLGSWSGPADLQIFWPDGTLQTVSGVAVDQLVVVTILDPNPVSVVLSPPPTPTWPPTRTPTPTFSPTPTPIPVPNVALWPAYLGDLVPGQIFTVDVTVAPISPPGLKSFTFAATVDPALLTILGIEEGEFIQQQEGDLFQQRFLRKTTGILSYSVQRLGGSTSLGSGTAAVVTFRYNASQGLAVVNWGSLLADATGLFIPNTNGPAGQYGIAPALPPTNTPTPSFTASFSPSFTPSFTATVTPTYSFTVTDTATPTWTPSFTVTTTPTATAPPTLTFTPSWTETATATRTATPTATVHACSGYDGNGDHRVDSLDIAAFSAAYGSVLGEARFNPGFDCNNDGRINALDLSRFSFCYGQSW